VPTKGTPDPYLGLGKRSPALLAVEVVERHVMRAPGENHLVTILDVYYRDKVVTLGGRAESSDDVLRDPEPERPALITGADAMPGARLD